MVATATEMFEAEGAACLINTVCVPIVLYVVWASNLELAGCARVVNS